MKTILVATDYSKSAANALEYAAALAKGMEARLVIYHAFSLATPPVAAPISMPDVEGLMQEDELRLEKLRSRIQEAYGISVSCISTTDLILDGISRQVKAFDADLVVLGMKGTSVLTKVFGSITTSVIKRAKFPVLVVPEDASFRGLRRILFACDYKCLSKHSCLQPIYELAAAWQAQVQILHVETEEELQLRNKDYSTSNAPNLEALFKGIKHTYRFIHEKDILHGIERGIDEFHADLAVMVPHRHGFWESIMHPSLTRKMALHSHVPLLALPATMEYHKPLVNKVNTGNEEVA